MEVRTFLRFEGRLWENMVFERRAGWETERVAVSPGDVGDGDDGDGGFTIELRTARGHTITSVSAQVDFSSEIVDPSNGMRSTIVVAYVPLNPQARELVFRRGDFVLDRMPVAEQPPSIRIRQVRAAADDRVSVRWSAKHPDGRPLSYNLVYLTGPDRAFPIARGLTDNACEVDLSRFPGSKEARVAVLATDGTRSAFAVSEPFAVDEKPPRVWIQTPEADATLPADQPVSLCGQALDIGGAGLPETGLIWRFDGEVVARSARLAFVENAEPGTHHVTLEHMDGDTIVAAQTITVRIAERSREQERFWSLMSDREGEAFDDF